MAVNKDNFSKDIKVESRFLPSKSRQKRIITYITTITILIVVVALGVGLGVGLKHRKDSSSDDEEVNSPPSGTSLPSQTIPSIWTPKAGTRWQIDIHGPLSNTSIDVPIYDIDLFENSAETIASLHSQGRKVICYFSAGSYEDFRPDKGEFQSSDLGKGLDGWAGEKWLNTTSENVRRIMKERMDMAKAKGCDGIDPDNVDGYNNDNGLGLSQDDAVDFVNFLAEEGHARNMGVGLKNAGEIVDRVVGKLQWVVNESCLKFEGDCDALRPFIEQGKPVFHIEYPKDAPDVRTQYVGDLCGEAKGFSTVLKKDGQEHGLDDWMVECPMV